MELALDVVEDLDVRLYRHLSEILQPRQGSVDGRDSGRLAGGGRTGGTGSCGCGLRLLRHAVTVADCALARVTD